MSKKQQTNVVRWAVPVVVVLLLALWIPNFMNRGRLPELGEVIQDFTIEDSQGETFTLSEAYAEGEVVLVFYRGYG